MSSYASRPFLDYTLGSLMARNRFNLPIGLVLVLGLGCSSGDNAPASTASAGAAGQGQAGAAGSSAAGSSAAGSSMAGSSMAGTGGAASKGGAAGSSSGGLPGIPLSDCTGKDDGSICDEAAGFVSVSGAFCEHEQCHLLQDFVLQCWNLVPTCTDGQSFGVFEDAFDSGRKLC